MHRITPPIFVLFLSSCLLSAWGCDAGDDGAVRKSTFDLVRDDLGHWLEVQARAKASPASLKRELGRPTSELSAIDIAHADTLRALYKQRKDRPVWSAPKAKKFALDDSGAQLLTALKAGVTAHGLYADDLHLPTIAALQKGLQTASTPGFGRVRFKAAELRLVREWFDDHPDAKPAQLARALADPDGPAPRLAAMVAKRSATLSRADRTRVRLDLYLSDALVEYGLRMKWSNPAYYRTRQWPEELQNPQSDTRLGWDDLHRARRAAIAREELAPVFDHPTKLKSTLASLVPRFEQYERLTRAFETYSGIVARGGWPGLPGNASDLKVGSNGPAVATLKERLAAEGYWKGDESPEYTPTLAEAVKQYQKTHQLWATGALSPETRASLAVPARRRLAEIRVALQRWRESEIGNDSYYVFVNVPDFHVELWKDGVRTLRETAVVGATDRKRDPETGKPMFPHATPTLTAAIDTVTVNPYWWVPADIEQNEIEPKIAADPWYLEDHGFEWAANDQGAAVLRQKPGAQNALGRVKISFDNPYGVFMHGTDEPKKFRWPARAFSHGCIRLANPLRLAQALLQNDQQWDPDAFDADLTSGQPHATTLEHPVPIHVEYYVVRVDDLGRANFLSDLYRKNVERMSAAMSRADRPTSDAVPVRTLTP